MFNLENNNKGAVDLDASSVLPPLGRRAFGVGGLILAFSVLSQPARAKNMIPPEERHEFLQPESFVEQLDRLCFWDDVRLNSAVSDKGEVFFHVANYPAGFLESDQKIHCHLQSLVADSDQFRMLEQQGARTLNLSIPKSRLDQWPKVWFAARGDTESTNPSAEISLTAVLASYEKSLGMLAEAARMTMKAGIRRAPGLEYNGA